ITVFDANVTGVAFAPDGKYLLATSGELLYDKNNQVVVKDGKHYYRDAAVRLFDVANGSKEVFRWKHDTIMPGTSTFAPDGKHFLMGASDALIRRWNVDPQAKDGEVYYKGAGYAIASLACSPDGRWLASWGPDYSVNLFELATGKKVRHWPLGEQFGSLAFAYDSRHLAVALGTGVVLILRL
ncbi:MAG: WD40 repeat domain-containing protein, partial [Gemmataceae bacterium]|nr:WD40 repeat domain-containing protein [Gemmataceae bacterium]